MYKTKLSMTAEELTHEEKKVMETIFGKKKSFGPWLIGRSTTRDVQICFELREKLCLEDCDCLEVFESCLEKKYLLHSGMGEDG